MNTLVICRKRGWKRRSRSNKASAFLSFFAISFVSLLIICSISTAYFSVPVYATGGWQYTLTVWELILSLLTGSGSAPVSAAANQAGMASPLGTYTVAELAAGEVSAAQCDAAIQALTSSTNAASQAAGGIAQSFATTAADAAQAAEALSAAGVEGVQAAEGAMSAGENLANCAAASVGAGSIVGMLGMQFTGAAALGAGAVAVVAGVGLGILGYNIVSHFADAIKYGQKINTNADVFRYAANWNASQVGYANEGDRVSYYFFTDNYIGLNENGSYGVWKYKTGDDGYLHSGYVKNGAWNNNGRRPMEVYNGISGKLNGVNYYNIPSGMTRYEYLQSLRNGTSDVPTDNKISPDIVNPNGNYSYNPTTNNYNYNYENNPTYNTTDYTLQPIYNTDYEQFINNTNYNTTNNIDNSQTFQDFISNYLTEYTAPAPDTDPDIPEQPVKPTVTPNTSEQIEQNKEMMLPVDLKDYFPFCIPFDIYTLMTHFEDIDREAPQIDIDLDLGAAGEYTINVDLSDYDDAASLLRALELIAFIIGLMVAARKLIGD